MRGLVEVRESEHDCQERDMQRVDHDVNVVLWSTSNATQGYQVYQCRECKHYWGCRYQWDAGTGSDNRWTRFGPNIESVHRHYH